MDTEQVGAIEEMLKLMAGAQTDVEGRPVDLLGLDSPDVWPWVCVGPAIPLEQVETSPSAVAHCPAHPAADEPSRVVLGRFEVGSTGRDGSEISAAVYVGQCADCGTIYWAWEAAAAGAESDLEPFRG